MTALTKYARLEATGLWRANAEAQRREVVVSIGEATLVISDLNDRALTHWSIAAIERKGSGSPAVFYPDGDPNETLEFHAGEVEMIEAVDTLRRAVARARPHPGRLRWWGAGLSVAAVVALGVFWLPGALRDHAMRVLPDVKRAEIGGDLLRRIGRVGGAPCRAAGTETALRSLAARTGVTRIEILPGGVRDTLYLPGGTVVMNRALVEDFEDPAAAAGFILAARAKTEAEPSLQRLLEVAGLRGTATLLTTGRLPSDALDAYAELALSDISERPSTARLLPLFEATGIGSTSYAYAVDISGETTLELIEADPMSGQTIRPIMRDADWIRLQAICES